MCLSGSYNGMTSSIYIKNTGGIKMRKIQILDCTLRDGGFVNDWNFGVGSIVSIIGRLVKAGIDIIEVGFIDKRRAHDLNRSIYPDTDSIKPIFKNLDVDKSLILGMIDFGTCDIESLTEQKDSVLVGSRSPVSRCSSFIGCGASCG